MDSSSGGMEPGSPEDRLAAVEQQLNELKVKIKLSRCFWSLVVGHTFLLYLALEHYSFESVWQFLCLSPAGTLAFWLATANRTCTEKAYRAVMAIGAQVMVLELDDSADLYLGLILMLVIVAGAFASCYALAVVGAARLDGPGTPGQRPVMSIRGMMVATACFAVLLAFAKTVDGLNPLPMFAIGGITGFVATSVAVLLFFSGLPTKVAAALLLVTTLVIQVLLLKSLGQDTEFLLACMHSLAGLISPLVTFHVLGRNGYRFRWGSAGKSGAPVPGRLALREKA